MVAWSQSPLLVPENSGSGSIGVFEFPTADAAKRYIEATANQISCSSLNYKATEIGDGVTPSKNSNTPRIDIFSGSDNTSKWKVTENPSVGGPLASSPTSGMSYQLDTFFISHKAGSTYGETLQTVVALERYLNLVISYNLDGQCCVYGFSNSKASAKDTRKSMSDLDKMAQVFRPSILAKLGFDPLFGSTASTTSLGT